MSNDLQNDELKVEQYDAAKAEAKRRLILKRVGIGVGVAALIAVLGYFGLVVLRDFFMNEYMVGGNGAWFNSKVVFLEDPNG